jgi:hypothetical protein
VDADAGLTGRQSLCAARGRHGEGDVEGHGSSVRRIVSEPRVREFVRATGNPDLFPQPKSATGSDREQGRAEQPRLARSIHQRRMACSDPTRIRLQIAWRPPEASFGQSVEKAGA